MSAELLIALLVPIITCIGAISHLAYRAGSLNQRVLQLEANERAQSMKLETMSNLMRETHDTVVRLEARQEAYLAFQQQDN